MRNSLLLSGWNIMASSNGGVPPGFRFHPTDEELLHYYLKKKVTFQKFDLDVIREVDLNKMEPWDLQEKCKIGSTPQNEWYFFSHKDRKYPTGSRTNRATSAGFWKATGRDKCIRNSYKKIGMRKTLVFYRGRAPHGQKTDWIMHEYRLEENVDDAHSMNGTEDGWVVCRVFKKKNLFKVGNEGRSSLGAVGVDRHPIASSSATTINNGTPEALSLRDHHLHYVHGRQEAGFQGFELALHHHYPPNIPATHFTRTAHDSLQSPKPLGYDFPAVTGESPAMMKQFLAPHRGFDGADQSLACQVQVHHQACDGGTEVASGSCHEPGHGQQMVEGRDEGLNEWAMLVSMGQEDPSKAARFGETTSASVHQINQLSVRGEMDLWGYGK